MFLDIYLSPHYQRRLLVLTLNSDHFHSRQKLCDIIDHGLAQQQQQPGRGGGLGPTDANMRIAGGGREVRTLVRTGRGDIAKLSQNVQLGAPATSSSQQPAASSAMWSSLAIILPVLLQPHTLQVLLECLPSLPLT